MPLPPSRLLSLLTLCAALALLAAILPATAEDTTRSLTITQFYVYPGGDAGMNKIAGLAWPEVETLNALVRIEVAGLRGDEKVSVFMAVTDPEHDDEVLSKHKSKHYLPSGTHDLVFPDFMGTGDVFGKRTYDATVEVAIDGAKPVQQRTSFVVTGPEPPDVDILDMLLYNPANGKTDDHFEPGDQFTFEATVEIENNEGTAPPELVVLAVVEEDMYDTDPEKEQSLQTHWDSRTVQASEGVYQLRASGYLPMFFADPWNFRHPFRVYVIVDFGPGLECEDYALGEIMDYHNGDDRRTDNLRDRLIELDRAYKWDWDRLRGGKPDTRRFWDK